MRRQFSLWTGLLSGWLAVLAAAMPLLADDPVFLRVTSVETSTPEAAARVADVEPGEPEADESSSGEGACTCAPFVDGDAGRAWARVEYLLWWTRGNRLPPLLTTSPDGTDRDLAGVLGQVETQLLFGDTSVNEDARSGGRLRFGYDLGDCSPYGVEFDLLGLGDGAGTSRATGLSTGSPILARPIINAQTGLEDAQLVAYPELVDGRLNVTASSELYAAAALLRKTWYHRRCVRSNLVGGYRFFRFREGLGLEENLISRDEDGLVEIGTRIDVVDRFSAKNTFHGGELGLDMAWENGPLSLELLATVALGNAH